MAVPRTRPGKAARPPSDADPFAPIARQSLRGSIADRVRASILDGTLRPGDRIVELTIARALGVSRAPLREALWQLAKEGLVRFVPNRGAFVSDLSADDVRDIFEVRESLEVRAALRIFDRRDPKDFAELDASCARLEAAGAGRDMRAFAAADLDFHRTIWRLARNPLIEELLAGVSARYFGYGLIRDLPKAEAYEFDRVVAEHRRLVDLIRKGPRARVVAGFERAFAQFRDYSLERFARRESR